MGAYKIYITPVLIFKDMTNFIKYIEYPIPNGITALITSTHVCISRMLLTALRLIGFTISKHLRIV